MPTDFYALLGVAPDATDDEIKRAYRRLARELHPDANPGNAEAEERFKEITVAYETLRDPERRRRYDMFGPEGGAGPGGEAFDFSDLFSSFFGGGGPFGRSPTGPPRAPDAEAWIELDLAEAAFGTTQTLEVDLPSECERCSGTGCEPGTHPQRCETCAGTGEVRQVRRSILGQIVTATPCPGCGGIGTIIPDPCHTCRGDGRVRATRRIEVEVPAGIDDGQRLRLTGRGPAAPRSGIAGDLYVTVRVRQHATLERHGTDLVHRHRIAMTQAALGTTVEVETLDGPEEVVVEPGTQPGAVVKIRGRGVPALHGRGRGDLLVVFEVEIPRKLEPDEAELLHQFAEQRGEEVSPPQEGGLFSRIKSAFQ